MKWKVIDTGSASAAENMAIDYALLNDLSSTKQPILHLYDWEGNSATYGHFADPAKLLNLEAAEKRKLQLAKRPTGGGLLFHLTDFAFSVLVPATDPAYSTNTMENYATVNSIVENVVRQFMAVDTDLLPDEPHCETIARHFCMGKPTKYDVMVGGRKVGGAAQRRTKDGYLHQGTIHLCLPPEDFLRDLLLDNDVVDAMQANSFCLLADGGSVVDARMGLRRLFSKGV